MENIESKESKLAKAIVKGATMAGITFENKNIPLVTMFTITNYEYITPELMFSYFEKYAKDIDKEDLYKLSGRTIAKLIHWYGRKVY